MCARGCLSSFKAGALELEKIGTTKEEISSYQKPSPYREYGKKIDVMFYFMNRVCLTRHLKETRVLQKIVCLNRYCLCSHIFVRSLLL